MCPEIRLGLMTLALLPSLDKIISEVFHSLRHSIVDLFLPESGGNKSPHLSLWPFIFLSLSSEHSSLHYQRGRYIMSAHHVVYNLRSLQPVALCMRVWILWIFPDISSFQSLFPHREGAQLNWVWMFIRIASSQMVQRQGILMQGVSVLQKEAIAAVPAVWNATGAGNPSSLSAGHNPTLRQGVSSSRPSASQQSSAGTDMVSGSSSNPPGLHMDIGAQISSHHHPRGPT